MTTKPLAVFRAVALLVAVSATNAAPSHDYPVKPVPFTAVHLDDVFWSPRIETNRLVTIPFAFEQCEQSGRMENFERAAKQLRGEPFENRKPPGYPFDDTDPYKVLEGAAYALAVKPNAKLDAYLDKLIALIASAQEPDGYLYTARTMKSDPPHDWIGSKRWVRDPDQSHELYNAGHLFEAAAAHYQATGKTNLLSVALKLANLLDATFGPETNKIHNIWPGHQIVEMGLAKLYRVTGNERYLKLAKFFLDVRGPGGDEYHQSQAKPVTQTEAVGHAVRATYMYAGMADVAALTGDQTYLHAIDAIWDNVVGKKLYITGGIGAVGGGEAFGPNYYLPNASAYNETCAAVANDYWNERLFALHGDAKYVDVLERTLYNGLISGVSLDGTRFFYPNPLEYDGRSRFNQGNTGRAPWFGCACCPGNITRFLASVPGYVYAQQGETLFVNLFAGGTADVTLDSGRKLKVRQETRYPWDGAVKITVSPDKSARFTVNVRIPGWARNEAVPGDLYKFAGSVKEPVTLKVNGKSVPIETTKGYVRLDRKWKKSDVIELNLPMPVRRVVANENVKADRGRVALQRGPVVYCAEGPDNPNGKVRNLLLTDDQPLTAEFEPALLNGIVVLKGKAVSLITDDNGQVVKTAQDFKAIPYYAWAHRGAAEMAVWIANTEKSVRAPGKPTVASRSKVTVSSRGTNPRSINDQAEPASSADSENSFSHWWPRKGTDEWVEYKFAEPATVSRSSVYWFDDTGHGECRTPASWRLLYKDGEEWKPVETSDTFRVALDKWNDITFKPVTTSELRLEVKLQPDWSAGIQEWKVE
jgi:uncharacterized protein